MRSLDLLLPVTADVAVAEIVGEDDDVVRARFLGAGHHARA